MSERISYISIDVLYLEMIVLYLGYAYNGMTPVSHKVFILTVVGSADLYERRACGNTNILLTNNNSHHLASSNHSDANPSLQASKQSNF